MIISFPTCAFCSRCSQDGQGNISAASHQGLHVCIGTFQTLHYKLRTSIFLAPSISPKSVICSIQHMNAVAFKVDVSF
jgi:hypothetical protein